MPRITAIYTPIRTFAVTHKIWSLIIALAVLGGGWWLYGVIHPTSTVNRYMVAEVTRSTIVSSISGSGQVSALEQVDIHPKASGDVTAILVQNGQAVSAGQAIAYLDSTNAQNTLRNAQADLASAQLSMQKLKQPADNLSLIQSQNALSQATASLAKSYDDGYNEVASTFADLPGIMTGLKNILYGYDRSLGAPSISNIDYYTNQALMTDARATSFRDDVNTKYAAALAAYNAALDIYKATPRSATTASISTLVNTTYDVTKNIADAAQSANNLIQLYKDAFTSRNFTPVSTSDTHITNLNSYTSQSSTHISTLLNIKTSIITNKQSINEKTASLSKLESGADPLDVQSSDLTIEQRQNAVTQAQSALSDYTIRAPFSGVIANLTLHKGDTVSSGTSAATLITHQQIAELSLNEVDAAKISVGEKATLTFDAIEGLSITGKIAAINPLGTVTQGVVSYSVKIAFDRQDSRVKPGMTVNANIQTAVHQNVITVPLSAIKKQGSQTYVLTFSSAIATSTVQAAGTEGILPETQPERTDVTVGISDDVNTEIVTGLSEGMQIVTRTINTTAAAARTGGGNVMPRL